MHYTSVLNMAVYICSFYILAHIFIINLILTYFKQCLKPDHKLLVIIDNS